MKKTKKNTRLWGRLFVFVFLSLQLFLGIFQKRQCPQNPQRILILHRLLFGDSIMAIPLLKALRVRFPDAQIVLALPPALVEVFQTNPYQIKCLPFSERQIKSFWALKKCAPFDIAILPAQNRYSLLCRALGARWIIGFEKDLSSLRNYFVDQKMPYPTEPMAFPDITTLLCPAPLPEVIFEKNEWPKTTGSIGNLPPQPFIVLHVGTSLPTKLWSPQKWKQVAQALTKEGFHILFTGNQAEIPLVEEIDPESRYFSLAGQCNLLELKEILEKATCVVSTDTGVAHLVKLTGTPSVALFGPGSALLYGKSRFWKNHPYHAITHPVACRNKHSLFERQHVLWVQTCSLIFKDCPSPHFCMEKITVDEVLNAVFSFFPRSTEKKF